MVYGGVVSDMFVDVDFCGDGEAEGRHVRDDTV